MSSALNLTALLQEYPPSTCTLETCPIILANIRYVPSLAGNATYLAIFMFLLIVHIFLGIRWRTWGFLAGMVGGLILEVIGYGARIGMHNNQFIKPPFFAYLITLTIAPAFLSASIYLCLGRIVTVYGAHLSRFKPRTYSVVFVTCDIISLILQAAGGAIAASGGAPDDEKLGEHIMLGGLIFQVVSLVLFSVLCLEFALRVKKAPTQRNPVFTYVTGTFKFKAFLWSLAIATVAIIIRSSFRVAELENGFASSIANDQGLFMALEGPMIMLAVVSLAVFHPGYAFDGQWAAATWSFRSSAKQAGTYSLRSGKSEGGNSMDSRLVTYV
ncbi:hypothetical protein VTN77DRAFT_9047 [Rasamsonia byssochlamydoides]|uniref:uncharacterized protein n=1 Tax=Rasamsonia byssochlamydoides TaxID=89139 RepID=UPI0037434101